MPTFIANMQCPLCGANLPDNYEYVTFTCDYCGTKLRPHLGNGVVVFERIIPESSLIASVEQKSEEPKSASVDAAPIKPEKPTSPEGFSSSVIRTSTPPSEPDTRHKLPNWAIIAGGISFLIIFCLCFSAIFRSSSDTASSRSGASNPNSTGTSTRTFTNTPTQTVFYFHLPQFIYSEGDWNFTITGLEVKEQIGSATAKNGYFLVALLDIANGSSDSKCLKIDEFFLTDGQEENGMSSSGLDPAKVAYDREYPGSVQGQCLDSGSQGKSILVFDIPKTSQEYSLKIRGKTYLLGLLDAIQNPVWTATSTMTLTPTFTNTPTSTQTPTITPTPLPSGKVNPNKISADIVNLRSGPGKNYPIVVKLTISPDSIFNLLGRNEAGNWLLIQTQEGIQAWIETALIETTENLEVLPISTEEFPTLTPTPTLTRTPVPTKTPVPTRTPIPTKPFSIALPEGTWCEQNPQRAVCVGGLEYKNYIGYYSAGKNSRYIVMAAVVKNFDSYDITINPYDFTLVMEDDRAYEHDIATYHYNNSFPSLTLAPGNMGEGALVFLVPKDVGPAKIIYRGGWFESDIVIDFRSNPRP